MSLTALFLASWECLLFFFFFNDTATTEIYTLSLHDALPISDRAELLVDLKLQDNASTGSMRCPRSEEHTSELQSQFHLVCRFLLEKNSKAQKYPLKHAHDSNWSSYILSGAWL